MAHFAFLDSIWFGEQCEYQTYGPEQWLAEVSGVPFGLPGQVLGDNREQWQALVFGMTCRIYPDPHRCNPRPLWAAIDALGLQSPRMLGWWEGAACPVSVRAVGASASEAVLRATLFVGPGGRSLAVAVANWSPRELSFSLTFDWAALAALGFAADGARARLRAPAIEGFQPGGEWAASATIGVQAKRSGFNEGWLLSLHAG